MLYRAKQKVRTGLKGNGILAVLSHKVEMRNIYFCSDAHMKCSSTDIQWLNTHSKIPVSHIGMFIAY